MGDVLRKIGANFVLLIPDDETNDTLNGSSPGADAISTTSFEAALWENGELVATSLAILVSSFGLTIDNVSGTDVAAYKVNLTLPNRSFYELWIRHASAMIAFRQEQFDLRTRDEIGSVSRENVRIDFTIATVNIPARQVAAGVLDKMRIRRRFEGAADFTAPNLADDVTVEFTYANLGDTNPINVIPI